MKEGGAFLDDASDRPRVALRLDASADEGRRKAFAQAVRAIPGLETLEVGPDASGRIVAAGVPAAPVDGDRLRGMLGDAGFPVRLTTPVRVEAALGEDPDDDARKRLDDALHRIAGVAWYRLDRRCGTLVAWMPADGLKLAALTWSFQSAGIRSARVTSHETIALRVETMDTAEKAAKVAAVLEGLEGIVAVQADPAYRQAVVVAETGRTSADALAAAVREKAGLAAEPR